MNRPAADRFQSGFSIESLIYWQPGLLHFAPHGSLFPKQVGRAGRHIAAPPVNTALIANRDHNWWPHLQHPTSDEFMACRVVTFFQFQQVPVELAAIGDKPAPR